MSVVIRHKDGVVVEVLPSAHTPDYLGDPNCIVYASDDLGHGGPGGTVDISRLDRSLLSEALHKLKIDRRRLKANPDGAIVEAP